MSGLKIVYFQAKIGYASLTDSKSDLEKVQLQLTPEVLVLLREEYVPVHPEPEEDNKNEQLDKVIEFTNTGNVTITHCRPTQRTKIPLVRSLLRVKSKSAVAQW